MVYDFYILVSFAINSIALFFNCNSGYDAWKMKDYKTLSNIEFLILINIVCILVTLLSCIVYKKRRYQKC